MHHYTDDERFVLVCIRVARKHRLDPSRVAREAKGGHPSGGSGPMRATRPGSANSCDRCARPMRERAIRRSLLPGTVA